MDAPPWKQEESDQPTPMEWRDQNTENYKDYRDYTDYTDYTDFTKYSVSGYTDSTDHTNYSDTGREELNADNVTRNTRQTRARESAAVSDAEKYDTKFPGYFTGGDIPSKRKGKVSFPSHTKIDQTESPQVRKSRESRDTLPAEVKRSWPEPSEKGERRIVSANYSAVEIHGFFGLIDDGSVGEGRMLIVHVPKWIRGYFLDIRQGDSLHVYHAGGKGRKVGSVLTVLSTGRHKYYAPGRRVMTCTVCVPEEQWAPFAP
jgi:hypothetical protein